MQQELIQCPFWINYCNELKMPSSLSSTCAVSLIIFAWSEGQQYWCHVEACEKCRLSAPTPQHLLNQKLHLTKIPQVILTHVK